MQIHHVQLAAPEGSEEAARGFFVGVLRMIEEPKPPALRAGGGCWFRREGCSIHVGIDPSFRPQKKAHPAFLVDDLQDLASRLEGAGHGIEWDARIPGTERFYTEDPFGNRLEFMGVPEEA